MSLYKNILKGAIKTTWNNKYLWFFGLFAALLGGGGEYNVLFRSLSGDSGQQIFSGWQRITETGIFSGQTLANIGQIMREDPLSFITALIVLLIVLVLFGFLVWLSVVSQAALVNNAASHLAGKGGDFKSGITRASEKFWSVFSLNIIIKLLVYSAFILISLPVLFSAPQNSSAMIFIAAFIVFIPIALVLSFIVKYAIAYVIIKNNNLADSIKFGWQLFTKNWLVSIEMALLLFLINFFAGLLIILVVLTLIIPFVFLSAAFYKIASFAGFWLIMTLGLILLLVFIVLSGAILSAFQISSWTGLFMQLVNKGGTSKIMRIAEGIKGRITK